MDNNKIIGILGGMGPIASAEYVKTFYELYSEGRVEQEMPDIVLLSVPSAPKRNKENIPAIKDFIMTKINVLNDIGIAKIVVCCFVVNTFLTKQKNVISLADMLVALTNEDDEYVLLGSSALIDENLLEKFLLHNDINRKLVHPNTPQQEVLNEIINDVKKGKKHFEKLEFFKEIVSDKNKKFIIACAELHVAHKM